MTGASGLCAGDRADRAVEREIGVDLVGEQRDAVPLGELDQRPPHRRADRRPRSGCSDR